MKAIEAWVDRPNSSKVADDLNRAKAPRCIHDRNPCYLRCGVTGARRDDGSVDWSPMTRHERLEWFRRVFGESEFLKRGYVYEWGAK